MKGRTEELQIQCLMVYPFVLSARRLQRDVAVLRRALAGGGGVRDGALERVRDGAHHVGPERGEGLRGEVDVLRRAGLPVVRRELVDARAFVGLVLGEGRGGGGRGAGAPAPPAAVDVGALGGEAPARGAGGRGARDGAGDGVEVDRRRGRIILWGRNVSS